MRVWVVATSLLVFASAHPARAESPSTAPATPSAFQIRSGSVDFTARTNLRALTIRGRSEQVEGQLLLSPAEKAMALSEVSLKVPVDSLRTGISVRDQHMREMVFQDPQGALPDLTYASQHIECDPIAEGYRCQGGGTLSIAGRTHPLAAEIRVTPAGGASFRAEASFRVKLSDYGIPAPRQFGVSVEDEVELSVSLTGLPRGGTVVGVAP